MCICAHGHVHTHVQMSAHTHIHAHILRCVHTFTYSYAHICTLFKGPPRTQGPGPLWTSDRPRALERMGLPAQAQGWGACLAGQPRCVPGCARPHSVHLSVDAVGEENHSPALGVHTS